MNVAFTVTDKSATLQLQLEGQQEMEEVRKLLKLIRDSGGALQVSAPHVLFMVELVDLRLTPFSRRED